MQTNPREIGWQSNSREIGWQSFNSADEQGNLDIWGFLRRRKAFVIVLALIGVGVGYLLFQQQTPRYRSSALVEVIHHSADKNIDGLLGERELEDAVFVVASPKVLSPAYDEAELGKLETFRGMPKADAIERMAEKMLEVEILSLNIFELSFEGPNAGDAAVVVNAVADVYIRHQKESYTDATEELKNLLQQLRGDLHEDLKEADEAYAKFRTESRLLSDGSNNYQTLLPQINARILETELEQTKIKSSLVSLEEALRSGGQKEALMLLVGEEVDDPELSQPGMEEAIQDARAMHKELLPLLMQETLLAQEVGADHPRLILLRKQIEVTRQHWDRLMGLTPAPGEVQPRPDFLAVYIQSLREKDKMLERELTELRGKLNDTEKNARALLSDQFTDDKLKDNKRRLNATFDSVIAKIGDTTVSTNIGGIKAQALSEARHGELVFPKLIQFLGIGGFLGAFLGLGLGYVVEMADRSFRKPEEIVREFGVPIVGHIPYMNEKKLRTISDNTVMDRTVVTAHLPRSRPAEAYRSVRTAICFSAVGNQHRILQVTSPTAGDGKSTLAVNLAVSLAQSGKRTVLVESDFRRPKVHKMTGVNNDVGIVDVLRGNAELADAIKSTEVNDFFVLPCGKRPRDPSELLTRPEYEALLQVLRQKFEYVVIDTPPVLVVTDPCSVAPRADAVIVCMRLSRHTRDFGRRTLEQLRDVGAHIAGISINGVEETDAYGYGSYNYSDYRNYYRDYGRSYAYKYAEGRDGYFSEEDEPGGDAKLLASTNGAPVSSREEDD